MKRTRDLLVAHFDTEELRDLTFHLGVYPDNFPATRSAFARELITYIARNEMWEAFQAAVVKARPTVDWSHLDAYRKKQEQAGNNPGIKPEPIGSDDELTLLGHAAYLTGLVAALPSWETAEERRSLLVMAGLRKVEGEVELTGSRHDAASRLTSAILRFEETDPEFVAECLALLYEAAVASGFFSTSTRKKLKRRAATLRNSNPEDGLEP